MYVCTIMSCYNSIDERSFAFPNLSWDHIDALLTITGCEEGGANRYVYYPWHLIENM